MISPNQFGNMYRYRIFLALLLLVFFTLISRLFYLQIVKSDSFLTESKKNAIRDIPTLPIRGNFYDRNGNLLVDNFPFYSITITPKDFHIESTDFIANLLNIESDVLLKKLKEARDYSPFLPSTIKRDIPYIELVSVEEQSSQLSGIGYRIEAKRNYPSQSNSAHIFGYLVEVSKQMIKQESDIYQLGDLTGGSGIEKQFESFLRGKKGHEFWLVNATGQVVGPYESGSANIDAINGDDLLLTIDDGLQAFTEELMTNRAGGAVAIDPRNGEILALVSKPDFDLRLLSGLTTSGTWNELKTDDRKPLFNRGTLTRYPPGSTFKMLVALAALQEGILTLESKLTCSGVFVFGNRAFKCHGGVHGRIDVLTAIQKSCNSFFYQIMTKLPLDKLHDYATMFGLGRSTKIDIQEQRAGLIPNTAYYDRVYGKNGWTKGYLISLGIGQGEVGVSPLQMATYTSILANGGTFFQPHLVKAIYSKEKKEWNNIQLDSVRLEINPEFMDVVRLGMRKVVESGTARGTNFREFEVAGKTGTAQNPHGNDHSWFVAFAPYDNPTIAICVMVENGGFGAQAALPVAREMLRYHFLGKEKAIQYRDMLLAYKPPTPTSRVDSLKLAD